MQTFTRIPYDPLLRGWDKLGRDYQGFHSRAPWNEYLWCKSCNSVSPDPYGPVGAVGLEEAKARGLRRGSSCPTCGGHLELFWSRRRTREYIEKAMTMPGFAGFMLKNEERVITTWVWGYSYIPKELRAVLPSGKTFYLDAIAVLPKHRKHVTSMVIHFPQFLMEQQAKGFTHSCMRTHKEAGSVKSLAVLCGYTEAEVISKDDPNRSFWVMDMNVLPEAINNMRRGGLA